MQKGNILFCLPAAIAWCENQPNSAPTTNAQQVKIQQSIKLIGYHLLLSLYKKKKDKHVYFFKKTINLPVLCFSFLKFRNVRNGTLGALKKMYLYN